MKKTQILSTIALAFSLGVVAPIAVAENASAVTASTKEAAEKDIENAKKSFGTVTLNSGEKVDGYTEYAYAAGQIDAANEVVTDAKEALSSTTTSAAGILKKGVDDAIAAATGITLSQATQDKIGSTKWTAGTLAEVTEIAQAVRGEYAARFNVSAEADAAKTAVAAVAATCGTVALGLLSNMDTSQALAIFSILFVLKLSFLRFFPNVI